LTTKSAASDQSGDAVATDTIVSPEGRSLPLSYFAQWGGPSVVYLLKRALEFIGTDLRGARVLEIGYGHGQMSCLFALLGADVVAVDTHQVARDDALAEAKRWGVSERIQFTRYSGDPRDVKHGEFDIAFTKSVLLLVSDLQSFLTSLTTTLKATGQIAFIENGFHNPLDVLARRIMHWLKHNQDDYYPGVTMYNWRVPVYLSRSRIDAMRKVFEVRHVMRGESPHWYLIHGFKRGH